MHFKISHGLGWVSHFHAVAYDSHRRAEVGCRWPLGVGVEVGAWTGLRGLWGPALQAGRQGSTLLGNQPLLRLTGKAVLLLPYGCRGSTGLRGAKSKKTLFLSDGFDDTAEFTQGTAKYF